MPERSYALFFFAVRPGSDSSVLGRRRHSVLYEHTQSARGTIHDACVPHQSPSPLPSTALLSSHALILVRADVLRTVRFKVIADDGTVILLPRETTAAHDEARA
jgi:hypothetical protein